MSTHTLYQLTYLALPVNSLKNHTNHTAGKFELLRNADDDCEEHARIVTLEQCKAAASALGIVTDTHAVTTIYTCTRMYAPARYTHTVAHYGDFATEILKNTLTVGKFNSNTLKVPIALNFSTKSIF